MATFRKVAGGYKAEVCVQGIRKSKTWPTKTEAKNWAAQAEFELGQQAKGTSITHTLGDVFKRYSAEVSQLKKGARWEIVRLNAFCRYTLASILLIDLKREHIEDWMTMRLKTVQPSSVNRELNLISHCLTQARRWRLMQSNPMEDLKRPKNPPGRDRRITDREIEAFLIASKYAEAAPVVEQQQRVAVAFLFALETAMRAGEICSLLPEDIDLAAKTAHLRETKNGFRRDVALSNRAVELLVKLQPWGKGEAVFGLSSGTLSTLAKRAISRAAISGLTFHDTRHEATTRLASKMDVLDLARMTGHRDIKQLLTYYNKSAADIARLLD